MHCNRPSKLWLQIGDLTDIYIQPRNQFKMFALGLLLGNKFRQASGS